MQTRAATKRLEEVAKICSMDRLQSYLTSETQRSKLMHCHCVYIPNCYYVICFCFCLLVTRSMQRALTLIGHKVDPLPLPKKIKIRRRTDLEPKMSSATGKPKRRHTMHGK